MEISGKVLREVEFRDRLRGYDTDEVDEFLEHVAVALDELLAQHAALRQRAESAERQLKDVPPLDDDGIRRTLVLAQRTADLAMREARAEAEQLVGEARARAEAVLGEAEDDAARLREDADREVRIRAVQVTEQHERLTREIRVLSALLESERTRITQSLTDALRFVGESMGVSDEVAALLGGRGDGPGRGDDGAERLPTDAQTTQSGSTPAGSTPAGSTPAGSPEGRSGELRPERRPTAYPEPAGEDRPPAGATEPVDGAPVPSGSASSGNGPAGSSGSEPSAPTAMLSGWPAPAGHASSASMPPTTPSGTGRLGSLSANSAAGAASRRANTGPNGSDGDERDIEAELTEDAGLSRDARYDWDEPAAATNRAKTAGGARPGDSGDPSDDDALWARWHRAGSGALDPLSDPPPTQAYRLDPDGGWSA